MASKNAARALPKALPSTRWGQPHHHKRLIATAVEAPEPAPFVPQPTPPRSRETRRQDTVRDAKPFSDFLTDTFNRQHDYLRISLTERCNLRCLYCMPEEGIQLSPNKDILTTAEIYYLSALFVNQGVNKIRLTGGEPTVRKDIIPLLQQLGTLRQSGLREIALTTNGISLHRKLDAMVESGLTGVNISLDTLDPHQFVLLTRRQGFDAVMKSINKVQEMNTLGAGIKLKINCVAMRGLNDHQILPFVEMTREQDVEVRFIEYMPFGGNKWSEKKMLPYEEMLDLIRTKYPTITRLKGAKNDTSKTWQVPGFKGRVGFITSMTHNFCGTCNRLRITSDGNLKVCLHGNTEVSLRDLLRRDHGGEPMDEAAFEAIRQIELDRRRLQQDSLRFDGEEGWISKERELLDVIGAAVKRKKAAHAGMGESADSRYGHPSSFAFRRRPLRLNQNMPWSRVPMHLLSSQPLTSQARFYSTRESEDETNNTNDKSKTENKTANTLASTFGFQSLSSLFQQKPLRGRYSRPRQPDDEGAESLPRTQRTSETGGKGDTQSNRIDFSFLPPKATTPPSLVKDEINAKEGVALPVTASSTNETNGREKKNAPSQPNRQANFAEGFTRFTPNEISDGRQPVYSDGHAPLDTDASASDTSTPASSRQRVSMQPTQPSSVHKVTAPFRIHKFFSGVEPTPEHAEQKERPSKPQRQSQSRRVPNPFSSSQPQPDTNKGSRIRSRSESMATWAIKSDTAPETSVSITKLKEGPVENAPQSKIVTKIPFQASSSDQAEGLAQVKFSGKAPEENAPQSETDAKTSTPTSLSGAAAGLTHVKSSGEAHMVDVGAKEHTRRVAIAWSTVTFSNPAPYELISQDRNKKGDVLGVARIAGIMAAKRTSDIIPLCHPVAITKVDVDVQLKSPGVPEPWIKQRKGFGLATIQVQVECTGQTGVEMEALTAASSAALTVYDMCKAVDRDIHINKTCVVYKSGGKSGRWVSDGWMNFVGGKKYFLENGLELPEDPNGPKGNGSDPLRKASAALKATRAQRPQDNAEAQRMAESSRKATAHDEGLQKP